MGCNTNFSFFLLSFCKMHNVLQEMAGPYRTSQRFPPAVPTETQGPGTDEAGVPVVLLPAARASPPTCCTLPEFKMILGLSASPRSAEQTLINDSLLPGGDKPLPVCLWRPQRPLPAARRAGLPRPARRYQQHVLLEQRGQGGLSACFNNNRYVKK